MENWSVLSPLLLYSFYFLNQTDISLNINIKMKWANLNANNSMTTLTLTDSICKNSGYWVPSISHNLTVLDQGGWSSTYYLVFTPRHVVWVNPMKIGRFLGGDELGGGGHGGGQNFQNSYLPYRNVPSFNSWSAP